MHKYIYKAAALAASAALGLSLIGCSALPEGTAVESTATATQTVQDSTNPAAATESQSAGNKAATETNLASTVSSETPTSTDFSKKDLNDSWSGSDPVIQLNGENASCTDSNVQVDGSTVTIGAEGTYVVSGTLNNGRILVKAGENDDVQIVLNGVNIASSDGPAIQVDSADKVILTLADGQTNQIADGSTYADTTDGAANAAIYSDADLSINGTGSLTVQGNYNNGIATKDDLSIVNGSITVDAVNHAIKGKDSVAIGDGIFDLTAGGDAIQSDKADDAAKGWIVIDGGSFSINAGNDGIQAETNLTINGGDFDITTNGGSGNGGAHTQNGWSMGGNRPGGNLGGMTPSGTDQAASDGSGITGGFPGDFDSQQSGGFGGHRGGKNRNAEYYADNISPNGGENAATIVPLALGTGAESAETVLTTADAMQFAPNSKAQQNAITTTDSTSTSYKGLKAETNLVVNGGSIKLNCADDAVHSNGDISLLGGSLEIATGDDGIHAEGTLTTRSDIKISTSYEGIEASQIFIEDGSISLTSSYDGINAAGSNRCSVDIAGGTVEAICGGDGIDSNGSISISGGDVRVYINSSADNGAIDADGSFVVTGGTVVYGGTGTGSGPQNGSTQSYVYAQGSFSAGQTVSVRKDGQELLSCTVPTNCSSLSFSAPGIASGETCEIYVGNTLVANATAGQGGSGMMGGMGGGHFKGGF